jgi:hypothetical protein
MAQFVADGGALKPGCRFGIFLPKGCFDGPIILVPAGMGHESSDPKTSLPPALIDIERRLKMGQSKWVLFHNFEQVRPDQPRYGTIQISWSSHCKRRAATVRSRPSSQATKLPPANWRLHQGCRKGAASYPFAFFAVQTKYSIAAGASVFGRRGLSGLNLDQISRLSDRETIACNSP